MHVKYKQDNLHRMILYADTCNIMVMDLLYMLALLSNVHYMGLGFNGCSWPAKLMRAKYYIFEPFILYLLNTYFCYFIMFLVSFSVLQVAKVHLWLISLILGLKTV
jgi:hypothetical protein